MSSVAVITARGGSKRIPHKNVKDFMGRPMIAYAIEAALRAELFDEVMVSTDDAEIAEIAQRHGASVPFLRNASAANDTATTRDAVLDVLAAYDRVGRCFDDLACLYPCVPFLTGEILADAYRRFLSSGADLLMPVVRYEFPVQRALRVGADGLLEYREPDQANRRTQDLEPTFHDAGMFYLTKVAAYRSGDIWRRAFYEMPSERVQDIDTPADWRLAELKYRSLREGEF